MRVAQVSTFVLAVAAIAASGRAAAVGGAAADAETGRLADDVCDRQVVMLGEDSGHGAGATIAAKAALVERLVDRCGFSAVFFESQVYDFLDLQRRFDRRVATRRDVADAIGGLWSTTAEMQPLIDFLHQRAADGDVRLLGMDPQLGGATQRYAMRSLAADLAAPLDGARKAECEAAIHRLANWEYDDAHVYDDRERERLRACAGDIARVAGRADGTVAFMARNLADFLEMAHGGAGVRDRAMHDNFAWQLSRLAPGSKAIIWCATVHALKAPFAGGYEPLGAYVHRLHGAAAASVGFTSSAGSEGRQGRQAEALASPPATSLEARIAARHGQAPHYVDAGELKALGNTRSRVLAHGRFDEADWSRLLDGIVVLPVEHPPHYLGKPGATTIP
jgi:erythromycin esterase-like protein